MDHLSQSDTKQSSVILDLIQAPGSDNKYKDRPRLTNIFRKLSMDQWPCATFTSSMDTKPATHDVVVAIAGMILPLNTFFIN